MSFAAVAVVGVAGAAAGVAAGNASSSRKATAKASDAAKLGGAIAYAQKVGATRKATQIAQKSYQDAAALAKEAWATATPIRRQQLIDSAAAKQKAYGETLKYQEEAFAEAKQSAQDAYTRSEGILNPYAESGKRGFLEQENLIGMHGNEAQQNAINLIKSGSQFKELSDQGELALLQNRAATGGVRGGNTQGVLAQFRPRMLQDLIDKQFTNLGSLREGGLDASISLSQQGTGMGNTLADLALRRGNMRTENFFGQVENEGQLYKDVANTYIDKIMNDYGVDIDTATKIAESQFNIAASQANAEIDYGNMGAEFAQNQGQITGDRALAMSAINQKANNAYGQAATSAIGGLAGAFGRGFGDGGGDGGGGGSSPSGGTGYGFQGLQRQPQQQTYAQGYRFNPNNNLF